MKRYKQLLITALIVLSFIFTAFSVAADVTGGNVTINTPTLYAYGNYNGVIPARGDSQAVYANTLTVNSRVDNAAYGGTTDGSGAVYNNTVTINSGGNPTVVSGGRSSGGNVVTDNRVFITGGRVSSIAYGGDTSFGGAVTSNTVFIADGGVVTGTVYGGHTTYGGAVTSNTVFIADGGVVTGTVYGGRAQNSGAVTSNTVFIADGGVVTGTVYGGYSSGSGKVENNIVNIEKTANLTNSSLFGRNYNTAGGTGNTLNVNSFIGDVVEVNNFDIYNFTLGQLDSDLTVINITGSTVVDIDDSNITISFARDFINNNLNVGDVITVISDIDNSNPDSCSVNIVQSPFIAYNFTETRNDKFLLTFNGMSLQPQTKALAEGFAAGLAFLGQAADFRSNLKLATTGSGFTPFAVMGYGRQHITTGSSVSVKGFSALAGLALNNDLSNGHRLTMGVFFEGGWGDYNSRNSFRNSATIKGSGDTEYYGGGVLARYAMTSGFYSEGAFAAGKTKTDFRTYDFTPGTRSKYDYFVPYYSAHIAVGQVFNLNDMLNLDVYGKYLWTRQKGDSVTVISDRFKFKDADSHRVRVGGKLQADVMSQLQPYVGAAYEYEFSGKIKGSLYGMNLDKPSLRGGTGIGELGLVWSPTESGNLKVDLGTQGYVGKREGVSGGLTVTMFF